MVLNWIVSFWRETPETILPLRTRPVLLIPMSPTLAELLDFSTICHDFCQWRDRALSQVGLNFFSFPHSTQSDQVGLESSLSTWVGFSASKSKVSCENLLFDELSRREQQMRRAVSPFRFESKDDLAVVSDFKTLT